MLFLGRLPCAKAFFAAICFEHQKNCVWQLVDRLVRSLACGTAHSCICVARASVGQSISSQNVAQQLGQRMEFFRRAHILPFGCLDRSGYHSLPRIYCEAESFKRFFFALLALAPHRAQPQGVWQGMGKVQYCIHNCEKHVPGSCMCGNLVPHPRGTQRHDGTSD